MKWERQDFLGKAREKSGAIQGEIDRLKQEGVITAV